MPSTLKQIQFDRQLDQREIREFKKTNDLIILIDLFHKYMPLVYGVCIKYLGNKNDARKAVQAIFEKVTVEIIKDEPLHFRHWLFQITMAYCTKKTNINNLIDATEAIHPLDDNLFRPDLLRDCIKQLLPDERTVIDQFYKQNKSYRQIAERLDKTEEEIPHFIDTAKVKISNCLNKSSQKNSDVE